ncbi:MAG TPA: F0F1 ATP synthase subunit A [Bacteroidota bacterium]|nr:F0F1 ATP synthase subunit A [Bacteroidota bacterium]
MKVLFQEGSAVHDTLKAAGGAHKEGGGNLFTELFEHAHDARELELPLIGHVHLPQFDPIHIAGITVDLSVTKHVLFMWVAALVVFLLAFIAARKNIKSLVPRGVGNLIEVFVVFIRDEIAIPNMGNAGVRYLPYLLTTFFFILTMNLMGMIPYGATSTSNINVTAALAVIAFFMIQLSAIRAQGFGHYLAHLTGGVHWALWPIMVPIEILGLFTKPFALCIRLFANMTGGHLVIISLLGLIFLFKNIYIVPVPIAFALGINMLELFVAFLQAYIFTMLTSLFMGLGIQAAHAEHEDHGH